MTHAAASATSTARSRTSHSSVKRFPGAGELYAARASAYFSKGDFDDAVIDGNRAIALDARSVDAYLTRGRARLALNQTDGALADLGKAIEIEPKNPQALCARGAALCAMGEANRGLRDFEQALALQPANAAYHAARGACLGASGDSLGAVRDFDAAIRLDPKQPGVYALRDAAQHALRQDAEAIRDTERALDAAPGDLRLLNNLAWLLATGTPAAVRDGPRAVATALKACQLGGWMAACFDTLAASLARNGDMDKAIEWQRRALASATDDAEARARLDRYLSGRPWPAD